MKKIGIENLGDIALGASLLGAGGGGDPYVGKLIAMNAIREHGEVTLLDPDELADDALIVPMAMMGAPTVVAEKFPGADDYLKIYEMVSNFYGRKIDAFMPMEAGGLNSMIPIAAAARLGIPLVDCDGMGRAFPELQMVTFTLGGVSASPMALADEKGNSVIFDTISNKWAEELARAITMSCGGSVSVSLYAMDGATLKKYGVRNIVSKCELIGRTIRTIKECTDQDPENAFLRATEGVRVFKGKISDVLRETKGAWNLGHVILEGIGEDKGKTAEVTFQNENFTASVDGELMITTPDLISLVDIETFIPVTTESLKYGKRVYVVGLPCYPLWRTKEGLELVGPGYFKVDTDYIPMEERAKGGKWYV